MTPRLRSGRTYHDDSPWFGSPEEEIDDPQRRFPGLGDFSAWWFMQSVGRPVPPTGG